MVTRIKKSAEEAKVACRNVRRDANKHFDTAEKNKEMTEDERDKGKEEVQTLLKTLRGQDRRAGGQEDRRKSWSSKRPSAHRLAARLRAERASRHARARALAAERVSGAPHAYHPRHPRALPADPETGLTADAVAAAGSASAPTA